LQRVVVDIFPCFFKIGLVADEVGGEGALYFDPHQPEAFAGQVKKLDTKKVRDKHIKAGREHMMQFHWQTSAETLLRLLPTE
jgi:hypothetical protein